MSLPWLSNPLTVRQAARERAKAREYWKQLSSSEKWALGDEMVLGNVDYELWFRGRPTGAFMNELDRERMFWESEER
jgi:hypothetical protein